MNASPAPMAWFVPPPSLGGAAVAVLSTNDGEGLSDVWAIPPVPTDVAAPTIGDRLPQLLRCRPWPRIPGYDIQDVLGTGGMGIVFRVHHLRSDRTLALKSVHGGPYAIEEDRQRLRAEARYAARLHHSHIAPVFHIGEHDGTPYYTLEFLPGGSLEEKLRGGPLPSTKAAELTEQLARAVHVFHEAGILHRDLKPGNILFTADGTPKITDFGLAKHLDRTDRLTTLGSVVGTPPYMAPEQTDPENPDQGPGVDLYALGVILYQMLTGQPPFRGKDVVDVILQVRYQQPVPPLQHQPDLPRDLNTICLKCLQKHAQDRYGSAAALADDLRRFLENQPIRAKPADWYR